MIQPSLRTTVLTLLLACTACERRYAGRTEQEWVAALDDSSAEVVVAAAKALAPSREGRARRDQLLITLWRHARDSASNAQMGAIEALALEPYRDGRTIPVLIEVLHQSAGVTRASAAAALAQFGPRAAAAEEALHTALRDSSDAVRHEAQHALRSIEGGKRH